jgi:hypothetical protein
MKPSVQHSACVRIISRLVEVGPDIYQSASTLPTAINEVVRRYSPATVRQITGILNSDDGFDTYSSHAFVYGPIVDQGTPKLWPVLTFSGDRGCDNLRVRVALFFDQLGADPASGDEGAQLARGVAWRFEPPEGATGAHCYYHAQPISSWDKTGSGRLPVHLPVNESQPGFPLMAEDSVSLLAAVLVSIYGHAYTADEIFGDLHFRRDVRPASESFSYLKLLQIRDDG